MWKLIEQMIPLYEKHIKQSIDWEKVEQDCDKNDKRESEWEDKREMNEQIKCEYQEYLDYMYKFEEENGHYPMHLSNGQWTPYSESEYLDKTKNGTEKLNF